MVDRRTAARYGAPLAFLSAVTVGVLLVRAGLDEGSQPTQTSPPPVVTATTPAKARPSSARYYRIQAGDTLAGIAPRFGVTEAEIVALNPGIAPTALSVGQRIRVR